MPLDYLAIGLVTGGVAALVGAMVLNRRLIGSLPAGRLRRRWRVLMGLEAVFIGGYLAYSPIPLISDGVLLEVGVPLIFFLGGVFVLMTVRLALETATDLVRIGKLEHQAATDPLTNVFNRRYLDARLIDEVTRACRYARPLSVLLIDLDHFKNVNDTLGHQGGDSVLTSVSALLVQQTRSTDIVARYGGEEFVIVAPETNIVQAVELAERLRVAIFNLEVVTPGLQHGRRSMRVTASIGAACLGGDSDNAKSLIESADQCLYRAKRLGRNRVATSLNHAVAATGAPVPKVTAVA